MTKTLKTMKKLLLLLFVVVFSLTQLLAQESTFSKGDKVVNLGIGLGSTLYTGSYYKIGIPPISASFEAGIVNLLDDKASIGVGGYLGYSSHKYSYSYGTYTDGWTYSNFIIGARGAFHYALVNKLDTYTGVILGFNVASSKWTGTGTETTHSSNGGLASSWFVGARYYFSDSFAVMAELGYGITYLNLGVALKF
jgi:hypothetical protein